MQVSGSTVRMMPVGTKRTKQDQKQAEAPNTNQQWVPDLPAIAVEGDPNSADSNTLKSEAKKPKKSE